MICLSSFTAARRRWQQALGWQGSAGLLRWAPGTCIRRWRKQGEGTALPFQAVFATWLVQGREQSPGEGNRVAECMLPPRGRCWPPAPSLLLGEEPSLCFLRAQSQLQNACLEAAGSPSPGTGSIASGSLFGSQIEPLGVFTPVFLSPSRVVFVSLAANQQPVEDLGKHWQPAFACWFW